MPLPTHAGIVNALNHVWNVNRLCVGRIDNSSYCSYLWKMKAELRLRDRIGLSETAFVELVVWSLPAPLSGSAHNFKYRLALVDAGVCIMRYDNEAGKGDHKHLGEVEVDYKFQGLGALMTDFWSDVERWRMGS